MTLIGRPLSFANLEITLLTIRGREPKQPALRIPIQWHLNLSATERMQIEMPWLTSLQDRFNDVRCQPRHSEHLAHPSGL
jgi:hypothetical protein